MARPRTKKNKDLPSNLYRGEGLSWRYRHPKTGKFHSMGDDKNKAIAAARKLNELLTPSIDLVSRVLGEVSFGEFGAEFLESKRRKDGRPLADNTRRVYANYLSRCSKWNNLPLSSLTLFMVNELLDSLAASTSIGCRSFLSEMFDLAISKGLVVDNPARQTLKRYSAKQRKRHTLEGLAKVRECAPRWLQNAIDLSMLTTQRRVDIANMKWADIYDGYLHVAQQKTTDDPNDDFEFLDGAGYVRIKVDAELQKVLDRCKDDIVSPFIIHRAPKKDRGRPTKVEKEHWTQIDEQYISVEFLKAVKKSNAYPELTGRQIPTFHEIRALSIFLHKKAGTSAQKLAGHTTEKMTKVYESGHEITSNDVDIGITLPFADVT